MKTNHTGADVASQLARIADALERLAPGPPNLAELGAGAWFVWRPAAGGLAPATPAVTPLSLLIGVEAQKASLVANTRRFAAGKPANHALLWGARGTGKSALIKAVHAALVAEGADLKLIDVSPEDLRGLPALVTALRAGGFRAILFVDDFSLEAGDPVLRALKPALQGGLGAGDGATLVYATSNRRHLLARDPRETAETELHWRDAAEDHLALSDRFGLSLGFHAMDQETYLAIVEAYAERFDLPRAGQDLRTEALRWSSGRGARSGRTAWQFIVDLAGRCDRDVSF